MLPDDNDPAYIEDVRNLTVAQRLQIANSLTRELFEESARRFSKRTRTPTTTS
jgi:hypothetical protein